MDPATASLIIAGMKALMEVSLFWFPRIREAINNDESLTQEQKNAINKDLDNIDNKWANLKPGD